jgi:hypothetical protein
MTSSKYLGHHQKGTKTALFSLAPHLVFGEEPGRVGGPRMWARLRRFDRSFRSNMALRRCLIPSCPTSLARRGRAAREPRRAHRAALRSTTTTRFSLPGPPRSPASPSNARYVRVALCTHRASRRAPTFTALPLAGNCPRPPHHHQPPTAAREEAWACIQCAMRHGICAGTSDRN